MRYFLLMFVVVIVFNACADEANAVNNDFTDENLQGEVNSWNSDPTASEGRTGPMKEWNVEKVTTMYRLFDDCLNTFNEDIASWDVGKVTNMGYMFKEAWEFNGAIGSWDVGKVTTMSNMFYSNEAFNEDIASWDVGKVTNMEYMFKGALAFNEDIASWDVGEVINMKRMFSVAEAFNKDIASWDVGKVNDMSNMFRDAAAFNEDIASWDVAKVTDMQSMFYGASAFNEDIASWDVAKVTDMQSMFNVASEFNGAIASWDVGKVTTMQKMFYGDYMFNKDIASWDVEKVTNMNEMFRDDGDFNDCHKKSLADEWAENSEFMTQYGDSWAALASDVFPTCNDIHNNGKNNAFSSCEAGSNELKADLSGTCATCTCAPSDCCDAFACDASTVIANADNAGGCTADLAIGATCTQTGNTGFTCTASSCVDGTLTAGTCSACTGTTYSTGGAACARWTDATQADCEDGSAWTAGTASTDSSCTACTGTTYSTGGAACASWTDATQADCEDGSAWTAGTASTDSSCIAILCQADMYVSNNACTSCASSTTNIAGDDASMQDTACDVSYGANAPTAEELKAGMKNALKGLAIPGLTISGDPGITTEAGGKVVITIICGDCEPDDVSSVTKASINDRLCGGLYILNSCHGEYNFIWTKGSIVVTIEPKECLNAPSKPTDGTVVFSSDNKHGSTVTYACNSGFFQSGDTTGTCDTTGNNLAWPSATSPPTCTACTAVDNALTGATYTCTSAEDSDVSACAAGYWEDPAESTSNTDKADVCTACTAVDNALTGATYTCTSAEDSDVSACAAGYWEDPAESTSNTDKADVCTACTAVDKALTGATYTCTSAEDSDVSACAAGYWEDPADSTSNTGKADVCIACTTDPNAASGATYTCTSAEDSDVSACADGFWENPAGSTSNGGINIGKADVCTACADTMNDVTGVVDGSCTNCNGATAAHCAVATCEKGYHTFVAEVGCAACADTMNDVTGVVDGSCTDCGGASAAHCADATCETGYHTFVAGVGCTACADTMNDVNGVMDGSCTDCDGATPANCADATCETGSHTFVAGVGCTACANIMNGVTGVVDGSCTDCDGATPAHCAAATCETGSHTFVAGVGCTACADTMNDVAGVVDGSCTACDGASAAHCAVATCKTGYHTFMDGVGCTEQQCVVGSIASYDANAVANTCAEKSHLTALTGTTTCDLGCAAGYFSSDIKGLTCTADGNAAVGAKNGGIECTACFDYTNEVSIIGGSSTSCTQCTTSAQSGCTTNTAAVCATGYHMYKTSTGKCSDINECEDALRVCGMGGTCTEGNDERGNGVVRPLIGTWHCACLPGFLGGNEEQCTEKTHVRALVPDKLVEGCCKSAVKKSSFLKDCSNRHNAALDAAFGLKAGNPGVVCEDVYVAEGENIVVFSGTAALISNLREVYVFDADYDFSKVGQPGTCLADQHVSSNSCKQCPEGKINDAGDLVASVDTRCECSNKPSPYMDKIGVTCDEYKYKFEKKCENNKQWKDAMTCRQSCFDAGYGYRGDYCVLEDDYLARHLESIVDGLIMEVDSMIVELTSRPEMSEMPYIEQTRE